MDLKEFIAETISAIADATSELQQKYSDKDILINPPSSRSGNDVYQPDSENYTMRRVQNISFDVAVTASSETSGEGKAGIKVLSLDIGAKAGKSIAAEQVSRVSFSIPLTLHPTHHEAQNADVKSEKAAERRDMFRRGVPGL